jgi:hypothetical protein
MTVKKTKKKSRAKPKHRRASLEERRRRELNAADSVEEYRSIVKKFDRLMGRKKRGGRSSSDQGVIEFLFGRG